MNPNKDGFINIFTKFIKNNKIAANYLKEIVIKEINQDSLNNIFNQIEIQIDKEYISKYVLNRYYYLINFKNNL